MTCATPPFRPGQNRLGIVARRESQPIMVNQRARVLYGVDRELGFGGKYIRAASSSDDRCTDCRIMYKIGYAQLVGSAAMHTAR